MGHAGGFEHLGPFQLDVPRFATLEQADAIAEQHRHEVQLYLVEQPGLQVLPGDVRALEHDTMSLSPAAALARSRTLSMSSATKVNVVLPLVTASRA
jgi:hypothetical protein